MIIVLVIVVLLSCVLVIGKIRLARIFRQEVKDLFAQSGSTSDQSFHQSQLEHLPEPVQRYFRHVLKEGQPHINYARIKHTGQFKTGVKRSWMNITGEQYAYRSKGSKAVATWQAYFISRLSAWYANN